MYELEFLLALKEYIERTEEQIDAEYGLGRYVDELVAKNQMPDVYAEVLRRIALPLSEPAALERERCASIAKGAHHLKNNGDAFANGWASAALQIEQAIRMGVPTVAQPANQESPS